MKTRLIEIAQLGETLEKTRSRIQLAQFIGDFLKKLPPEEISPTILLLIGKVFPPEESLPLEISGNTIWKVILKIIDRPEAEISGIITEAVDFGESVSLLFEKYRSTISPVFTLKEVYWKLQEIARISGPGSREKKEFLLEELLRKTSPVEAKFLVKAIIGEMRHGVNEGMILEALTRTLGMNRKMIQRANLIYGNPAQVAKIAFTQGEKGLQQLSLQLGHPLQSMLAANASSLEEAFEYHKGKVALEYKLDGARVQIHKDKDRISIFSRHLKDVTFGLPDIAEKIRENLNIPQVILEGEVIAVNSRGHPLPFQNLMRRFHRIHEISTMMKEIPADLYLFDILYQDGNLLIDRSYQERWENLENFGGKLKLVPRILPQNLSQGETFLKKALEEGHEGLMAKYLESEYTPGVRGKAWFKVKPAVTLDLMIVAADYGYGRRHGWLSNYHLAARDETTSEFMVIGKTFKGLTDKEFVEMTRKLKELQVEQTGFTVKVIPQIVVEVAFNEIQRSPHYHSGFALRFARIIRIREDKKPEEADTLQTVNELYQKKFLYKGREEFKIPLGKQLSLPLEN